MIVDLVAMRMHARELATSTAVLMRKSAELRARIAENYRWMAARFPGEAARCYAERARHFDDLAARATRMAEAEELVVFGGSSQ